MKKWTWLLMLAVLSACSGSGTPVPPTHATQQQLSKDIVRPQFNGTSDIVQSSVARSHSTSTTCTFSSAPSAGNVLIFAVGIYSGSNTTTAPTGVTAIDAAANSQSRTYYRVVQSGDGASWTFTASATAYLTVGCWEIAGEDSANPIDGHAASNFSGQTTVTTSSVTPANSGDLPLAFFSESQSSAFSGLSSGWSSDYSETAGAEYMDAAHGPIAGTSAVSASVTFGASSIGGSAIVLVKAASSTPTPSPTPSPTPTPNVIWQAGTAGIDNWKNADTAQCGSPVASGTSFTMDLVKNGTTCGRNQAQPLTPGGSIFNLTMGQQYTWTFHYIDGTTSDGAPGMGLDTGTDPESLIWQIHGVADGGCGSPTVNLGFMKSGGTQVWYFEIVQFDGHPLWTGAYTPQEQDDWKIVVKVAESGGGYTQLWRNGTEVYSGTSQSTACSTDTWWNFGPYKWRWELAGGGGSNMSEVNATFNGMTLTEP